MLVPSSPPMLFTNIAAYQFTPLTDLKPLRERLAEQCRVWELKGTILLSTEGVNLFVAGKEREIQLLLEALRAIPGLENLQPKVSESVELPFSRMLVRIKKEIIAFGIAGVEPARRTSPKLSAQTLKQWLDEGRPLTLLDTRNDYEVKLGTFQSAQTLGIDHFRQFPAALDTIPKELKKQPVVIFCTGGIRCEKAGPYMEMQGFEHVYQLDGGILKYFEECGSSHYNGECFVFDQRVGVDPSLHETASGQCFVCQAPLSPEDQEDSRYVAGHSCPHCYRTADEQMREVIEARQAAIRRVTTPLPGSVPCDNFRPLQISARHDRQPLLDVLCSVFPQIPQIELQRRCQDGLVLTAEREVAAAARVVRSGERYLQLARAAVEPPVDRDIQVLFEDEALIVVRKPAPLPMHSGGRFDRNTLQHILNLVYAPEKPRPAHRLDANTTGVVVFSRTRHFAGLLQPQFAAGSVQKLYLTKVHGTPLDERFACEAPISVDPGEMGLRAVDDKGLAARTEFRVIDASDNGITLLEARPITGRTNQIRIHLAHLGYPIVGDQVYGRQKIPGTPHTLALGDPPLCLHSWKISFLHPLTCERLHFEAEPPGWSLAEAKASIIS